MSNTTTKRGKAMFNQPGPILRTLLLSFSAAVTAYRIFNNGFIAIGLGLGMGVLGTALVMRNERNQEAERLALWQERERQRKEANEPR
jgi:hypothetical protein